MTCRGRLGSDGLGEAMGNLLIQKGRHAAPHEPLHDTTRQVTRQVPRRNPATGTIAEGSPVGRGLGRSTERMTVELDEIDRTILRLLQENARTANAEIGRTVGL